MQICADTLIGDDQIRGVSGGQRKRVTTGKPLQCLPCFTCLTVQQILLVSVLIVLNSA